FGFDRHAWRKRCACAHRVHAAIDRVPTPVFHRSLATRRVAADTSRRWPAWGLKTGRPRWRAAAVYRRSWRWLREGLLRGGGSFSLAFASASGLLNPMYV